MDGGFQRIGHALACLHGGAAEGEGLRFTFLRIERIKFLKRVGQPSSLRRSAGDARLERRARFLSAAQRRPRAGGFSQQELGLRPGIEQDAVTGQVEQAKPFMLAVITFDEVEAGTTRYTARVRHWTVEDREAHEKMGFHEGWGQCADQLAELLKTI